MNDQFYSNFVVQSFNTRNRNGREYDTNVIKQTENSGYDLIKPTEIIISEPYNDDIIEIDIEPMNKK